MLLEITFIVALSSPQAIHAQAVDLVARGEFRGATLLTQAALREYNPSSLESALMLRDLAKAYRGSGYLGKAEDAERREIEILRARLGEDDANMALALNILAEILIDQSRFTDATRTLKQALQIAEARLDAANPHIATILNDLGVVSYRSGRVKDAAILFHRALEIRESPITRANLGAVTSVDAASATAPGSGAPISAHPAPATH